MPVDPLYHSTLGSLYDQSNGWRQAIRRSSSTVRSAPAGYKSAAGADTSSPKSTSRDKTGSGESQVEK